MEFLKNISFIKKVKVIESTESQQNVDVPDWHKEIVQKRIKESKPDDFFPYEDLDNKIRNTTSTLSSTAPLDLQSCGNSKQHISPT